MKQTQPCVLMPPPVDRMPNASDSERAILGGIILNNILIAQAVELLKPTDFYVPSHRRIFVAMISLFERGSEIDPILLAEELRRDDSLDSVGGPVALSNLTYGLPPATNISKYADLIREKSALRMILKIADKISVEALEAADDSQAIISRARKQIDEIPVNSNGGKSQGFGFTPLDQLLLEPKEAVLYVVDQMFRCGGFSIIAAKPKVGKTTLAFALAVAVSWGRPFFGRRTQEGKVLILCLEEHRAEVAERLRRMGANVKNIVVYTGAAPRDAPSALTAIIDEYEPALVIIDPLSRFVRVTDFNSYAEVTRVLEPLIDTARLSKCQTHVLALHHAGKGGDQRDGIDAPLGSTALAAAVDTMGNMRKKGSGRTFETTQRHGVDLPETIVHLDLETGIVSPGGDMGEFTLNERKKAVLDSMVHDPIPESAIKESIGGNAGLTSKAVRALYDDGRLLRSGAGKKGDPFLYWAADLENPQSEHRADSPIEKPGFPGLSSFSYEESDGLTVEEQEARAIFEEANKTGVFAASEVESVA